MLPAAYDTGLCLPPAWNECTRQEKEQERKRKETRLQSNMWVRSKHIPVRKKQGPEA
jgi:hypothetical protein